MHIPDQLKSNPLVNPRPLPYGAVPYDEIKPEHFVPAIDWAIDEARTRIAAITESTEAPTFANTVFAYAFASEELTRVKKPIEDMTYASNTPGVQKAYETVNAKLTDFSTERILNSALFRRIEAVYNQRDQLQLDEEEAVLLESTYNDFATKGARLEGSNRSKFKYISKRLASYIEKHGNNVVNHKGLLRIVIPPDQAHRLQGVPADDIAFYKTTGEETEGVPEGSYVIPMSPPPVSIFDYCDDAALREEAFTLYKSIASVGKYDNTKNVHGILRNRQKIAHLLGFENYADQVISTGRRMSDDYREILSYLETNAAVYKTAAEPFYEEIAALAYELDGLEELKPSDRYYYTTKLKEREIGFKPEDAKPYFELESCLKGVFACARQIFGIDIQEVKDKYPVLHPDIRTFEVTDPETKEVKGIFYADFYAREFKNGGAWMNNLRDAGLFRGEQAIPIANINLNLAKQAKVLLTPDENLTLFHEFGHNCHGMVGKGKVPALTGTNTSWDYVELPSQALERWAFMKEVLELYAYNEDGELIPDSMIEKLKKSEQFDARWSGLRQAEMGLLDVKAHTADPAIIGNLKEFETRTLAPYAVLPPTTLPPILKTFTHSMGEWYGAGYYVYQWANSLVADVREPFDARAARGEGAFPPDLCSAFSDNMIRPGGTRHGARMLADFKKSAGCADLSLNPLAIFRAEGITVPPEIATRIHQQRHMQL